MIDWQQIGALRVDFKREPLNEAELADHPIEQFRFWFQEAVQARVESVDAMTLATADETGEPHARMVVLRHFDEDGLSFFTNFDSPKAHDLAVNPRAAVVFFWPELERQIRVRGRVVRLSLEQNTQYFQTRPIGSRLSAWASPQSSVVPDRHDLENRVAAIAAHYGENPPLPPFWGGFRILPAEYEFWQGRPDRLHDRVRYRFINESWRRERLAP